ncbi:hypothetical protein MML48_4g00013554 [Holotrichia oblita]|uniref:Uncharacterized protein n=1 Tax=Holotrichia oblita TaxID=644536 RepID=A0ACB9T8V3_HOLOL|nr:hypothetical protein MML48_4g00013554 [Holotrichia oblita]
MIETSSTTTFLHGKEPKNRRAAKEVQVSVQREEQRGGVEQPYQGELAKEGQFPMQYGEQRRGVARKLESLYQSTLVQSYSTGCQCLSVHTDLENVAFSFGNAETCPIITLYKQMCSTAAEDCGVDKKIADVALLKNKLPRTAGEKKYPASVTVFLISSTSKLISSQNLVPIHQDDASFSSSILHQNVLQADQQAENAINVNFGTNDVTQFTDQDNQNPYNLAYIQSPLITNDDQVDKYTVQALENPQSIEYPVQSSRSLPSSQSFNVGYSVKFGGAAPFGLKETKQRPIFLKSDIITGTNKEEVMKPENVNIPHEEFVLNAVLDFKKQKISGIKPKYNRPIISSINTEKLITQANLSPKTQMKLEELQRNVQPNYDNDPYLKNANNSPWKTLSPGVEIYKSKPIKTISSEPIEEPKRFDHAKALGRSITFDYSNVVDMEAIDGKNYAQLQEIPMLNQYTAASTNRELQSELDNRPAVLDLTNNHAKDINNEVNRGTAQRLDTELLKEPTNKEHGIMATQETNFNYYTPVYQSNIKNTAKPTLFQTNHVTVKPAQQLYQIPKQVNPLMPYNFNKHLENIYTFAQLNSDSTYTGYNDRTNQFHGQSSVAMPTIDLTKDPLVPQYITNQPSNMVKANTQMYSVKENQQDDVKPVQNLVNQKLYGKNIVYIPYNNPYGMNKKIRPNRTRYIKDTKKYIRPRSRNKMHPRPHMY